MSKGDLSRLGVLTPPALLTAARQISDFDCGKGALNRFLQRYALQSQQAGTARTYAACRGDRLVGYYSLAAGSVEHAVALERIAKGIARHPIPVMVLARLAVDQSEQGGGLGKGLFKDVLRRAAQAADLAGIRALFVQAKDEEVLRFTAATTSRLPPAIRGSFSC